MRDDKYIKVLVDGDGNHVIILCSDCVHDNSGLHNVKTSIINKL